MGRCLVSDRRKRARLAPPRGVRHTASAMRPRPERGSRARERRRSERPRLERLTGIHCVHEALRAERRELGRLLVRRGAARGELAPVLDAAERSGVPVVEVDSEDLPAAAGDTNPQGVVLEAGPLPELSLGEVCGGTPGRRRLVLLDGVEDPQNVGAIARIADAAGVQGLVLTKRRAPPLSPALARASAGAIEWLPVARVSNLSAAMRELQSRGFWLIGADPQASGSLFALSDRLLCGDLAAVLGSEGRGIRPAVRGLLDHVVRIPMEGHVGSLNVAAAGAVLLFELMRRAERTPAAGGSPGDPVPGASRKG